MQTGMHTPQPTGTAVHEVHILLFPQRPKGHPILFAAPNHNTPISWTSGLQPRCTRATSASTFPAITRVSAMFNSDASYSDSNGRMTHALMQSPLLAKCRGRVVEAGYEVKPAWANGAKPSSSRLSCQSSLRSQTSTLKNSRRTTSWHFTVKPNC